MLRLTKLCKNFGGVQAICDLSLEVTESTILGVIGPNGAGKTTLLNLISGLIAPDSGTIELDGANLVGLPPHEITRMGVGRTFQNLRLIPQLTVEQNIELAACCRVKYGFISALFGRREIRDADVRIEAITEECLVVTELQEHRNRRIKELPYGTQKRVEIARALALTPKVLMLDEPAAGLNPAECLEIEHLVRSIHRARPLSIILVEHHVDMVMQLSHEIAVLDFGRLIARGHPEEVSCNAEVIRAYLGEGEN